jgi:hypothetical protein
MLCAVALMIQLTFQAAFDPLHTVFRFLRLRPLIARRGPIHRDHARILDFYLLFPFRISDIRLMPRHRHFRELASRFDEPYGEQPDAQSLFSRMEIIQTAAMESLARQNLIELTKWSVEEVGATAAQIPAPLMSRVDERNNAQTDLLEFIETLATEYSLLGSNGLKSRTGLLEYRYDAL